MYKIAIDSREYGKNTGVGTYLTNLLEHFDDNVLNIHLAVKDKPKEIISKFTIDELPFPKILNSNLTWTNFRLLPYLIKNKFDLYHSPFFTLPLFKPCKMIVTIHDVIFNINAEWFPLKNLISFKLFTRTAVAAADKIITDSEASKADIVKYYGVAPGKIEVIYLAPDKIYKAENGAKKGNYILYVGNFSNRKNIVRLIRAYEKLKLSSKISQDLVLAGGGGYKSEEVYDAISCSKVRGNIKHIANASNEELSGLYNGADLFVYPSLYEGFGLPILEAFACGIPVATSNNSSLSEISADAALLFDPFDVDDISRKIEIALNDKELANKIVEKGSKRVKDFSWDTTAKKTLAVYYEVLKSGS